MLSAPPRAPGSCQRSLPLTAVHTSGTTTDTTHARLSGSSQPLLISRRKSPELATTARFPPNMKPMKEQTPQHYLWSSALPIICRSCARCGNPTDVVTRGASFFKCLSGTPFATGGATEWGNMFLYKENKMPHPKLWYRRLSWFQFAYDGDVKLCAKDSTASHYSRVWCHLPKA